MARKTSGLRAACALTALALVAAACSNAASTGKTADTAPAGTTVTTLVGDDFTTDVPVDAPGVTSTEIHVGSITSKTNPIGGDNGILVDGIKAYFDVINAKGGIYGRKLKLTSERDDQTVNNTTETEGLLGQDNVFAAFEAVELFTGAKKMAAAGIPTFGWNINPEWAGPDNFFPNVGPICFEDCNALGRLLAYAMQQTHSHRMAAMAYAVPQSAAAIAGGIRSIKQFGKDVDAEVVFSDLTLAFGTTDYSAQVAEMKAKKVDFLVTALDFNGDYAIAKEMQRQGIRDKVTFLHPNLYNSDFVKQNGDLLEGDILLVPILAAEHSPAPAALQEYLDTAKSKGIKITEMTEQGWFAARQFVEALKATGPNFTRANLISAWNKQKWFSNGGVVSPIDWTVQHNDPGKGVEFRSQFECANFVKVHNGGFVGIWDAGGSKPYVCFDGHEPDKWQTPVNLSFDGKPFDYADVPKG